MKELAFYLDESGCAYAAGTHVVAALVTRQDRFSQERAEAFWRRTGLDWRSFHGCEVEDLASVLDALASELSGDADTIVCAAWHRNETCYGFKFDQLVAIEAILEGWRWWLERQAPDGPVSVPADAMIESSRPLNEVALRNELATRARRASSEFGRPAVALDCHPHSTPKGTEPRVQLADLCANALRRELLCRKDRSPATSSWRIRELRKKAVASPGARQVAGRIVSEPAVRVEVEKVTVMRTRTVRDARFRSEELVAMARDAASRGASLGPDDCAPQVDRLLRTDPTFRGAEYDLLLGAIEDLVEIDRDMHIARALCGIVLHFLDRERERREFPESRLDSWLVDCVSLEVLSHNHAGEPAPPTPRLEEAERAASAMTSDMAQWERVARFLSFRAVNLHDRMQFAEADRLLETWARFFTRTVEGPSGPFTPRGYWVGALLGTYAQGKAFQAHERYFLDQGASLETLGEEALLFSFAAAENFQPGPDVERHAVYRAHVHLQRFLLSGHADSLQLAEEELRTVLDPETAADRYLSALGDRRFDPVAFLVAAWLKLAWCRRTGPAAWIARLAETCARPAVLGDRHPDGQVLGYLGLLSTPHRRTFRRRLEETSWTGLLRAIAIVFAAQIDYEEDGTVAPQRLDSIREYASRHLPSGWMHGRFERELQRFGTRGAGRPPGPLVLLPFNYC